MASSPVAEGKTQSWSQILQRSLPPETTHKHQPQRWPHSPSYIASSIARASRTRKAPAEQKPQTEQKPQAKQKPIPFPSQFPPELLGLILSYLRSTYQFHLHEAGVTKDNLAPKLYGKYKADLARFSTFRLVNHAWNRVAAHLLYREIVLTIYTVQKPQKWWNWRPRSGRRRGRRRGQILVRTGFVHPRPSQPWCASSCTMGTLEALHRTAQAFLHRPELIKRVIVRAHLGSHPVSITLPLSDKIQDGHNLDAANILRECFSRCTALVALEISDPDKVLWKSSKNQLPNILQALPPSAPLRSLTLRFFRQAFKKPYFQREKIAHALANIFTGVGSLTRGLTSLEIDVDDKPYASKDGDVLQWAPTLTNQRAKLDELMSKEFAWNVPCQFPQLEELKFTSGSDLGRLLDVLRKIKPDSPRQPFPNAKTTTHILGIIQKASGAPLGASTRSPLHSLSISRATFRQPDTLRLVSYLQATGMHLSLTTLHVHIPVSFFLNPKLYKRHNVDADADSNDLLPIQTLESLSQLPLHLLKTCTSLTTFIYMAPAPLALLDSIPHGLHTLGLLVFASRPPPASAPIAIYHRGLTDSFARHMPGQWLQSVGPLLALVERSWRRKNVRRLVVHYDRRLTRGYQYGLDSKMLGERVLEERGEPPAEVDGESWDRGKTPSGEPLKAFEWNRKLLDSNSVPKVWALKMSCRQAGIGYRECSEKGAW